MLIETIKTVISSQSNIGFFRGSILTTPRVLQSHYLISMQYAVCKSRKKPQLYRSIFLRIYLYHKVKVT